MASPATGKSFLLMQRDEVLLAQPFDTDAATLSGSPVHVADGVGAFAGATSGLWSVARDGSLVYRSGGAGLPQLTWLNVKGEVVGTVGEPTLFASVALSADGRRVAFSSADQQGNVDIWVRDLARGSTTKLTFDPGIDNAPVWSPDGTRVIFAANRGGRLDLYREERGRSGEERLLLKSEQDKTPTSWSSDGRFLLFQSFDPKTREDIWVLPFDGDRKPFVFLKTEAQEQMAQFSPDMRWISYVGATGGLAQIFVRPFSAHATSPGSAVGSLWMISTNGGLAPRWRADGKRLF